MIKTAVVILNWNGKGLLERFLPRVVRNTDNADVIVADNASTDGSVEWVSEHFENIRIQQFDKNYGFAGGYNRSIKELKDYDIIVLLNSDAAPENGWIEPLVSCFKEKDIVAVQPKILSEKNHNKFEYAGASGGFIDKYGYPYCRGRIFDVTEEDKGQYDTLTEVFWASGAALAVRRDSYLSVGGLDEDFFAHMEEIDLCWRLKLAGGRIVCQPASVVYHLGGASLHQTSPEKTYLNFRNNLLMLHKNLPRGVKKDKLLFVRRLLDTLAWVRFLLTGKPSHAGAIWRAHRDFSTMKKQYVSFPETDLTATERNRNILLDFYVRGKRTF